MQSMAPLVDAAQHVFRVTADVTTKWSILTCRKPLKMAPRMVFVQLSDGGGMHSVVKWRKKRGVTSWRPPEGPSTVHSHIGLLPTMPVLLVSNRSGDVVLYHTMFAVCK
jgi:hypothetical protein